MLPMRWRFVWLLAALVGAYSAQGQPAQPAAKPLTAEQKSRLAERDRFGKNAERLENERKFVEAIAAAKKALAIEREVLGDVNDDVSGSLDTLGRLYEASLDFATARTTRTEALGISTKLHGENDWRTIDVRLALANNALLEKLTPAARQELAEAGRADLQSFRLFQAGRLRDAIPIAEKGASIRKRVLGDTHLDYATSLDVLAYIHNSLGDFAKAEPLFCQALEIKKKALGEDHPSLATTLNNLALLYDSQGLYVKAEPLVRQALEIRKRTLGEAHPHYVTSLNNLAQIFFSMGLYGKAEPLFCQALDIQKKTIGEAHPDYATSLHNLAGLYLTQGDYAQADLLYGQSLRITKDALGDAHPEYAISLSSLAELYRLQGAYARAEQMLLQALEIKKKTVGDASPEYASSLNNLASVYLAQGAYVKAEPLLRLVGEIQKKARGATHPSYALALNNLAELYRLQGAYARAEPLFRQALTIKKNKLGDAHPEFALSLNNLALNYKSQGAYAQAEPLYRQALEINKHALGEAHPRYAISLNSLAILYHYQGAFKQAEPLYKQALEIQKKALGEAHPEYAKSLHNLASLYESQGAYSEAERLYRQALEIKKKTVGDAHPSYAATVNNLAALYLIQGANAEAERLYRQALEITKKTLGAMHPDYASSLNNLAEAYRSNGALAQAEPLQRQALEITRTNLIAWAIGQSEQQQRISADRLRFFLDDYLSASADGKAPPNAPFRFTLAWKGAIYDRRQRVLLDRDRPELKNLFKDYQAVSQQLAAVTFAAPNKQLDAWQKRLAELNSRRENLEAELSRQSAAFRTEQSLERVNPEQLAKAIPSGTALIDFLEYEHSAPPKDGPGKWLVEQRLTAFVVRSDRQLVRVELGPIKRLAELIDRWHGTLKRQHPIEGKDDPALDLRRLLWEPLAKHIEGATTILISPDGAVCKLPFAALPGKDPEKYLIEELSIASIPVPQLLPAILTPAEAAKQKNDQALSMLVVGDVDFDVLPREKNVVASDSGFRRRGFPDRAGGMRNWKRLDATAGEILEVEDVFKKAGGRVTVLRGADATVERVRPELGKHAYAHLATHGFFAPAELKSQLQTTPEAAKRMSFEEQHHRATGFDPGLLSGLVLAGANQRETTGDSGILTATEVAELDLRNVELAVLSACETGLGEVAGGEGVLGLQRAFQVAGARTVVTSLWKVDDNPTRDLMVQFYRNYRDKGHMLEALRSAQLTLLRDGPKRGLTRDEPKDARPGRTPPYYWAAFVLSGDWR